MTMTFSSMIMAALGFLGLIIFLSFIHKATDLNDIENYSDENVLFEESGVKVEQGGLIKGAVFINCIVRVTNQRIIIAQKNLFSDKYSIKHIINYGMSESDEVNKKRTYYSINLEKDKIRHEIEPGKKNRTIVVIEIPYSKKGSGQYLRFITSMGDQYQSNF